MAVTLTGTSSGDQGLFNRLGRIGYLIGLVNTQRGTTLPTEIEDVIEYFDGCGTTLRATVEDLLAAMRSDQAARSSILSALRTSAENTVIEMLDADAPLVRRDLDNALAALKKQMLTATTTYVDANTVSASVTKTSLTGTGNVVTSVKNGSGYQLDNILAERLRITVEDTTNAGAESIRVRGEEIQADKLAFNWPLGSGADNSYTSLAADSASNLVTNGDFEDFTANAPDNWTIVVGAAGADIDDEASVIYAGAKALKITGDGATLSQIRQSITGLDSLTPYAVNFWAKMGVAPAAGVLTVDLFDGSSVINDEAGTANSFTVDLTTLGTTYVACSGVFRLPEPVPSTVYLRVRVSTAITNTRVLYIDHLAMQEMEQPDSSNGTPYIAFFSGATAWSLDDGALDGTTTFKIETANDRASEWQQLFDRLFDTGRSGYLLPTSGTTLINDNLIA